MHINNSETTCNKLSYPRVSTINIIISFPIVLQKQHGTLKLHNLLVGNVAVFSLNYHGRDNFGTK